MKITNVVEKKQIGSSMKKRIGGFLNNIPTKADKKAAIDKTISEMSPFAQLLKSQHYVTLIGLFDEVSKELLIKIRRAENEADRSACVGGMDAIDRIKENGLDAINSEIQESWMFTNYDLAMSFQVFEHLENPIKALRDIKGITNRLIITVPYIKKSGIGIQDFNNINPENTHLFLLCPNDWGKLFRYTGWKVRHEEIYYQYPRRIPLLSWLLKKYWKWIDYEGFYGVILEKEIR